MSAQGPAHSERTWAKVVWLFFLAWALNYANRTVLSPLLIVLGSTWQLGNSQLGLFNSLFFLVYTGVQIPVGYIADRVGHKRTLMSCYFFHAVGSLMSALAWGPGSFAAARVVAGLGQSSSYLTQYSLAAAVIPEERRAFGNSIINSGMGIGMAFGLAFSSILVHGWGYGWRVPFAILGFTTVVMFLVLKRELQWVPEVFREKQKGIAKEGEKTELSTGAVLLRLVPAFIQSFCSNYGFFALLTWLPAYLETAGYAGGLRAGLVSTLVPLLSIPGSLAWAWVSDWGKQRGYLSRRQVMGFLVTVAAASFWLIAVTDKLTYIVIGLIGIGLFGFLSLDPLTITVVSQLTPPEMRGTMFGVKNFCTMLAAIISPYLTGYLADLTGGFRLSFYVAGIVEVVAILCLAGIPEPFRQTKEITNAESA